MALVTSVIVLPSVVIVMLSEVGGAGVMAGEAQETMNNETMNNEKKRNG
jgi:hypothetical protein